MKLLESLSIVLSVYYFRVVEFSTKEDMKTALKKLDDSEFFGRHIKLKVVSRKLITGLFLVILPIQIVFRNACSFWPLSSKCVCMPEHER